MKITDIDTNEFDSILKIYDLENIFDIFRDGHLKNVFNLNKTLYINVNVDQLPEFICDHEMQWTLVSYKLYGTTRLAWLLWKINGVDASNIFKNLQPNDRVKYLPTNYVDAVVADINDFGN